MARIVPVGGGDPFDVPDETAQRLVKEGKYEYAAGETVTLKGAARTVEVPAEELAGASEPQETGEEQYKRESEQRVDRIYGTPLGQAKTFGKAAADAATFGGFSKVASLVDDDYTRQTRYERKASPVADIAGTATGAILPGGAARLPGMAGKIARGLPAAKVDALGARLSSRLGGGALGATARGAAEGFAFGAAEEGREITLSDNDLLTEQSLSAMATSGLMGGVLGGGITGGASLAGRTLSKGFDRARRTVDGLKKSGGKVDDLGAEVATYEKQGREAYLLAQGENSGILGTSRGKLKRVLEKSDDIEGKAAAKDALVAERKVLEDIASNPEKHLEELRYKDDLVATRMKQKAEKAKLKRNVIDERIAQKEEQIAKARAKGSSKVGKYEADLELLKSKRESVRVKLEDKSWTDTKYKIDLGNELRDFRGGGRKPVDASIETVEEWIEGLQNDALTPRRQAAMAQLPEMIEKNKALASAIMPEKTLLGEIAGNIKQTAQSGAAQMAIGAVAGGPLGVLAAAAARPIVNRLGSMLAGRIGKAATEVAERTNAALDSLLSVGGSVGRKSAPVASKVLSRSRFGPEVKSPSNRGSVGGKVGGLVGSYRDREKEILSHVEAGPDGNPRMRMSSRRQIARRLEGVRAVDPIAADRIETHAARRIEFLARKLPKRPDVSPGNWRPSDMQIRQFARSVASVDDPAGVVERAAAGTVTPEDAEALREVYPEQYANIQRQIIEKLPELRDKLPSRKRIALSILTGMPVDPALDPRILAQLQSSYRFEPGTEGGTHAPTPQPQFGSVKAPDPTPAQSRAANERG